MQRQETEPKTNQSLTRIAELAELACSGQDMLLVDTRWAQQGRKRSLEITVCRKDGPTGLDDCQKVSRSLEEIFEQQSQPVIQHEFLLEVLSPGIDRVLKTPREFQVFTGHMVEVHLRTALPVLGATFTGKLEQSTGSEITISDPRPLVSAPKKGTKGRSSPSSSEPAPANLVLAHANLIQVRLSDCERPLSVEK